MRVGSSVGVGGGVQYLVSVLAAVVAAAWMPVSAQGAFGLEDFDVRFSSQDGSPAAQAASHPFAMTVSAAVSSSGGETEGRLRELVLDLPPGLVVNPLAVPRCPTSVFLDPEDDCPLSTIVGTSSASLEPDAFEDSHIYSLLAPEGVPLQLGFEVAGTNVVADLGPSVAPPHNLIATAGDWPETVDVFATDLVLWGVPAAAAHDAARGGPVGVALHPFLTLPASCDGPQETFYEAVSWEGEEAFGSVVTHDNATPPNPLGFTGCGNLDFGPELDAQLTTDEATVNTGFNLSLAFYDEGLENPEGLAQSLVRDLALAMPDGLELDTAAVGGLERCSEAEFEAAGLEGGGCPEGSMVGSVEIESPLLSEPVGGEIFAAEPLGGGGIAALDLYVVVEDQELGLVVKQVIELEPDPETGELVAFVEDLPMVPFGDLRVHFPEGPESLLITPLCGVYDGHDAEHEPIRALLNPSTEEGPFLITASFEIVSGPNGGPCPDPGEGGSRPEPAGAASVPPAPSVALPDTRIFMRVLRRQPPIFQFRFRSTETGSNFRCKLDSGPFRTCNRSKRLQNLKPGRHVLSVFAIAPSGARDPSPAVVRFRYPRPAHP